MPNSALALHSRCKVTQSTSGTTQFDSQLVESTEKDAGQKETLLNVLNVFIWLCGFSVTFPNAFYVFETTLESSNLKFIVTSDTEKKCPCLDLGFSPISCRVLHINRLFMPDCSPMHNSTLNVCIYLLDQ